MDLEKCFSSKLNTTLHREGHLYPVLFHTQSPAAGTHFWFGEKKKKALLKSSKPTFLLLYYFYYFLGYNQVPYLHHEALAMPKQRAGLHSEPRSWAAPLLGREPRGVSWDEKHLYSFGQVYREARAQL